MNCRCQRITAAAWWRYLWPYVSSASSSYGGSLRQDPSNLISSSESAYHNTEKCFRGKGKIVQISLLVLDQHQYCPLAGFVCLLLWLSRKESSSERLLNHHEEWNLSKSCKPSPAEAIYIVHLRMPSDNRPPFHRKHFTSCRFPKYH